MHRVNATPANCNKSAALATCNDKSKKLQRFYDVCSGPRRFGKRKSTALPF
jgi:hypothetical protein